MHILQIHNLNKEYAGGFQALKDVSLEIRTGEIFALLGPNGAGKTTLINCVCGLVTPTGGEITVDGFDVIKNFRRTRAMIGLVPQELTTDAFETVWNTVSFSRGLFGCSPNPGVIEDVLKKLSLWDKRNNKIMTLSGGMKRRVLIAKALAHEPRLLFLDEPTAGVDVTLRRDMWAQVRRLQEQGVTIILTTHYIEEAEEMADRIGVINKGQIVITETTNRLMSKLGQKELVIELRMPMDKIPSELDAWNLSMQRDGLQLVYRYDALVEDNGISDLLAGLSQSGIAYHDLHTSQSSLEDIFIQLVNPS
jgi:ABC-2 type transport system ATP-binding protein